MKFFLVYILFSFALATPPFADPGLGRYVGFSQTITLDGTGSFDPDGGEITTYTWTAPDGITLSYSNDFHSIATFNTPSYEDTLTFSLSVIDDQGEEYEPYPSDDIFISEYGEGSSGNTYVEIYNGTENDIDLTGYELQVMRPVSDNVNPELELIWDNPPNLGRVWILAFNSDISQTDIVPEDGIDRADVDPLLPGQTLVVARRLDSDIPFEGDEGVEYVLWDYIKNMTGDRPIALRKNGLIIDKVGDEGEDPGSGFEVAGTSSGTKNNTLVRKGTIISGNTDWASSAGTDSDDSEWIVYDQNYFENIFMHSCYP